VDETTSSNNNETVDAKWTEEFIKQAVVQFEALLSQSKEAKKQTRKNTKSVSSSSSISIIFFSFFSFSSFFFCRTQKKSLSPYFVVAYYFHVSFH
jgi:hypothetical protein